MGIFSGFLTGVGVAGFETTAIGVGATGTGTAAGGAAVAGFGASEALPCVRLGARLLPATATGVARRIAALDALTAGKAFVAALGLDGVTLVTGHAENGATPLASVQSQPVSTLVKEMLLNSDNTLGEMLARIVSVKESQGGTSSSLQKAITTALAGYGVDAAGLTIIDGSGESPNDSIPPLFMAQFMAAVSQGKNGLQAVAAGMPLAGKTGDLATRFTGPNAVAAGKISAKPGFLAGAYTLSGYLTAKDGTPLAFSFAGVSPAITSAAQTSLDTLATGVYNCGKNLSGN